MQKISKFLGLMVAATLTACGGGGGSPGASDLPYTITLKAAKNQLPINIANEMAGIGAFSPFTSSKTSRPGKGMTPFQVEPRFLVVMWPVAWNQVLCIILMARMSTRSKLTMERGGPSRFLAPIGASCWTPTRVEIPSISMQVTRLAPPALCAQLRIPQTSLYQARV